MEILRLFEPEAEGITSSGPLTVGQVIDWYAAHEVREYSPIALKERRRQWELFKRAHGDKPIGQAKPFHLLDFITSQARAKSNHTRRRIKATINKPFNVATEIGLIACNPFRGIKIPKGGRGRDWTKAEYQMVLRNSCPNFRRFVVFLRMSGVRPGEARTLKWAEVYEELQVIVQAEHKTAWATDEPRRIHFNHVMVKLLAWLKRHGAQGGYVFGNSYGRPWSIKATTKHMAMIRKRGCLGCHVKLNGLRHTFATNALVNDVDLFIVSQLLGHRSVKTTEIYLHLVHQRAHLNAAMNQAITSRRGD